jgi:para-aminobenzoate synthetase/4-amino-4-deoxychorismate lyase
MIEPGLPFVLLDDARPGGACTLYRDPEMILTAYAPDEVRTCLAQLRAAIGRGRHVAGWLAYEAGYALEPKLARLALPDTTLPLMWFGVFERAEALDATAREALLHDPAGAWIGAPRPAISRDDYDRAHERVQALIAAGDIYQANLSFRAEVPVEGHPLAVYARLRANALAGWGGIIHDGRNWLLSLSPELFFRTDGSTVVARPMKGTAPRGYDAAEDAALAAALAADPKQRAENLMIVDLIRNDLSRVAMPGSVVTPALFAVEHYPTVHQMVSSVEARLTPGRDAIDLLEALFPCGSVTGAPKVRAMEVIAEVETDARGPYTGTIGAIAPNGGAAFNVAIRTLVLEEGKHAGRIGLGSAVVADSTADGEWRECLAKGAFLTMDQPVFDLFETMLFEPEEGIVRLEEHIARLGASARHFDFAFDRHEIRNELHAATFRQTAPSRVRLMVGRSGAIAIEVRALPATPPQPIPVRVVPLPVDTADFRLRHKTTDRAFYADAREDAGMFEVVFVRPDGLLTEGSFTSLFVPHDGKLVTPPLELGLLPGIRRALLIEQGKAVEGRLTADDLAGEFFLANDLRGLMKARLA